MFMGAGAVGEHHGLAIGIQEYLARPGQAVRSDAEQCGFVISDAGESAAHGLHGELVTALPDAPGERAVVVQPRAQRGGAAGRGCVPE